MKISKASSLSCWDKSSSFVTVESAMEYLSGSEAGVAVTASRIASAKLSMENPTLLLDSETA